jgi:hypothetical protein
MSGIRQPDCPGERAGSIRSRWSRLKTGRDKRISAIPAYLMWAILAAVLAGGMFAALALSPEGQCVRQQTEFYRAHLYALVPERADDAAQVHCMYHHNVASPPKFDRPPRA